MFDSTDKSRSSNIKEYNRKSIQMIQNMKICKLLKTKQQIKGYTQKDVAGMMNVTQTTASRYYNEAGNMRIFDFVRLCEILDVDISEVALILKQK